MGSLMFKNFGGSRRVFPMIAHPDRQFDPGMRGAWLIPITVAVSYIAGFIALGSGLGLAKWAVLGLLGVINILLAYFGDIFFCTPVNPLKVILYFVLQTIICSAVQYIGQGNFWLMLMPLASTAAAILSRWATAVFYAVLLAAFLVPLNLHNAGNITQNGLIFGCALVFVWVFTEVSVRDQQARREVERLAGELERANTRLRESAAQAEELARSRERNRLAREIHDSLGHYLTVVNVQLEAARALLENKGWRQESPDLYATLEKAQTLTRSGLADVRRSVAALRTDPMGDKSFLEAVKALIGENQEAGLMVNWRMEGAGRNVPPQAELALYRTLQEALTNVRKHARASRVDVRLDFRESSIRLEVADNGVGLSTPEGEEEKFGLRGIRERVELLQGRMDIADNPGGGVKIAVELPLEKGE
jgi:signal transduction histidine kinase